MGNSISAQNKLLLGSAITLLSLVTLLFYFSFAAKTQSIDTTLFQVEDWKSIQEIEMKYADKEVSLAFTSGAWRVNNKFKADRNLIDVLFATLIQAKAKREVTGTQKDSLLNRIKKSGVEIKLNSASGNELRFIAGGNVQKSNTYFVSSDNRIFHMHIPGYRVYVSGIFELAEGEWVDKLIFDLNWINFKKLTYSYKAHSFEVIREENLFQIQGIPTDTSKLHQFLDGVSLLQVSEYEPSIQTEKMKITGKIEVQDVAYRTYSLGVTDSVRNKERLILVKDSLPAWVNDAELQTLLKSREFYQKSDR